MSDPQATCGAGMRGFAVAGGLLALAGVTSTLASSFIAERFADRPMPRDLLLNGLPYVPAGQYVADATVLAAMLVLAVWYLRHARHRVPRAVTLFALLYLLRSAMIVLTPLASPHGGESFGLLPPQMGMFPSGHAGNVLLCVLLADKASAPRLRRVMLALAITEWTALLLSRGHYSIDILGGLLLAYFVYTEWSKGKLFDPLKRLVGER